MIIPFCLLIFSFGCRLMLARKQSDFNAPPLTTVTRVAAKVITIT
jgi:hypothetical protein